MTSRHSDKRQNSVAISSCSIDVRNVSSRQSPLNQSARRKINNGSIVGTSINKIYSLLHETSFVWCFFILYFILQNWYVQFEVKVKQQHRTVRTKFHLFHPLCCSARYNVTVTGSKVTEMKASGGQKGQAAYVQNAHFVDHTQYTVLLYSFLFKLMS